MQGSIAKWGNSLALRLSKSVADDANFAEGDSVDIRVEDGAMIVRGARPKYRLDDMLADFRPEHRHDYVDFGKPRGIEEW